jgi:hypothetical protein
MKKFILATVVSLCALTAFIEQTKTNAMAANTKSALPTVSSAATSPTPALNWNGKYTVYLSYGKIAGANAGIQLDITITPNSIIGTGEGFQLYFKDKLKASPAGNKLTLRHVKNLEGSAYGKTMNPEFVLTHDKGKFYLQSKWINGTDVVEKPTQHGYLVEKVK